MPKRLYIETVGCQMNVLDSELVAGLAPPATNGRSRPRPVISSNCSFAASEDKIYSALGRLKDAKSQCPPKIIGVIGCMAQKDRETIFRRAPHVDLVVGPGQLDQLPTLLERVIAGQVPQIEVSLDRRAGNRLTIQESFTPFDPVRTLATRPARHQAMVRILFGCDKFCTYCIVPAVRGPEQSRPAAQIEAEVRQLADQGCLEVTLLGQTVNSYQDTQAGRKTLLADLLYRLHDIGVLRRLRFVTNCPRHMSDDLLQAVRDLPKVCPYLHVPAQSGSDRILQRMKRGYSVEQYREMLARIRDTVPQATVTSDFIVGFCGETEEDFQQTVDLVREGRFKNSFIFKYSPRPGTKAVELYADDVPEAVKRRRNNELLAIQNAISEEENRPLLGQTVEILVEGPSKVSRKHQDSDVGACVQLTGRTPCDRIVVFDGPPDCIGQIVPIEVQQVNGFTLFGTWKEAAGSRP